MLYIAGLLPSMWVEGEVGGGLGGGGVTGCISLQRAIKFGFSSQHTNSLLSIRIYMM